MKRIFQILICCILILTLSACGQLTDIYSEFKDDLNASVESSDGEFENEDDEQDKMIRATRKSDVTKQDLIDTFNKKGLIGVYNLGLKNMLDYLNGN